MSVERVAPRQSGARGRRTEPMPLVGVIGLGRMGAGIAATLLRSGYPLIVHDVEPARIASLSGQGARAADSIEGLQECETILLSLPSSPVTVEVLETGLLPVVRPGTTVIDLGTTVVRETQRLHALFASRGVDLLDAPVSGGSEGAAKGALYVFGGGDRDVFERSRALLSALAIRLTWCGPSGSGQVAKAVNQLAMGLVDAAYIEAVAFGVGSGVDAHTLAEAIGGDSGFRLRLREIAEQVARGNGDSNDVKYAELPYFIDEADRHELPAPMLRALHAYMSRFPERGRDNMARPYPPLWSALIGHASGRR